MHNERKPSEIIEDFIELLKTAQSEYDSAKSKCDELDSFDRKSYWFHKMEFAKDKNERNRLATALQKERRDRRKYKDKMDLYKVINDFASSENNKAVLKRLIGMLGRQKHEEEYLNSEREYKAGDDS